MKACATHTLPIHLWKTLKVANELPVNQIRKLFLPAKLEIDVGQYRELNFCMDMENSRNEKWNITVSRAYQNLLR